MKELYLVKKDNKVKPENSAKEFVISQKRERESDLKDLILPHLYELSQYPVEHIYSFGIDKKKSKYKIKYLTDISDILKSTDKGAIAMTEMAISTALDNNCTGIVIAHNHPCEFIHPSEEDLSLTEYLDSLCKENGLILYDHFIVSKAHGIKKYYSFYELKLLRKEDV